jgi:hypothetical protein
MFVTRSEVERNAEQTDSIRNIHTSTNREHFINIIWSIYLIHSDSYLFKPVIQLQNMMIYARNILVIKKVAANSNIITLDQVGTNVTN